MSASDIYSFAGFEVDPDRGELRRDGQPIALRPKPFGVLLYLTGRAGSFVSKQELLDNVWPNTVVSETALTSAVKAVRRALGDDGERQALIENKRGRGYRLTAEVTTVSPMLAPHKDARELMGRAHEKGLLDEAVDQVASGQGCLVLLRGPAGIGKSRLLEAASERLGERGIPHRTVWCNEGQADPSFGPWLRLLDGLRRDGALPSNDELTGQYGEVANLLAGSAASATPTEHDSSGRDRLFDSIVDLLSATAERRGLGILIDDAHAGDAASLQLLTRLSRGVARTQLLIVVAIREPASAHASSFEAERGAWSRSPGVVSIELAGLEDRDAYEFVNQISDGRFGLDDQAQIVMRAGGNPFFLRELARASAPGLPAVVRDALENRLGRRSAGCREVLQAAAVLGRHFETSLLPLVLDKSAAEVQAALDEAHAEGLITAAASSPRFDHDLIREAVLERAPRGALAALHARVARVLEAQGAADPEIIANHLASGTEASTLEAARASKRAGARAMQLLAYENAIEHFERAIAALDLASEDDAELRGDLNSALGTALYLSGAPFARVEEPFERSVAIARERGSGRALARAAFALSALPFIRTIDMRALCEEALQRLDGDDDLRIGLLARLAIAHRMAGRAEQAQTSVREAMRLASKTQDASIAAVAAVAEIIVDGSTGTPAERLEQRDRAIALADRGNRMDLASIPRWNRFFIRLAAGDPDAVQDHDAFAAWIEERRFRRGVPNLLRQRASLAFLAGNLDVTDELLDQAIELASAEGGPATLAFAMMSRTLSLWQRGDANALPIPTPTEQTRSGLQPWLGALYAGSIVGVGRREEARDVLSRLDPASLVGPVEGSCLAALSAVPAVEVGDRETAERLLEWVTPIVGQHVVGNSGAVCLGAASRYAGLLHDFLGAGDRAEELLVQAIRENDEARAPLWAAHSRVDLAKLRLSRTGTGDGEAADSLIEETRRWCAGRGLGHLEARLEGLRSHVAGAQHRPTP